MNSNIHLFNGHFLLLNGTTQYLKKYKKSNTLNKHYSLFDLFKMLLRL